MPLTVNDIPEEIRPAGKALAQLINATEFGITALGNLRPTDVANLMIAADAMGRDAKSSCERRYWTEVADSMSRVFEHSGAVHTCIRDFRADGAQVLAFVHATGECLHKPSCTEPGPTGDATA